MVHVSSNMRPEKKSKDLPPIVDIAIYRISITTRQQNYRKVVFSVVYVCLFTAGPNTGPWACFVPTVQGALGPLPTMSALLAPSTPYRDPSVLALPSHRSSNLFNLEFNVQGHP